MESKSFSLILQKDDKEVFELNSNKGDALAIDDKTIKIKIVGDKIANIESCRFNTAVVKIGKKQKTFKVSSYTQLPDNGNIKLCFNICK